MSTSAIFTAADTAPDGEINHLAFYRASDFPPGSAVLCRNSAPLIALAYGLLQRDVPCRILGRDIGQTLITLVKKMRAQTLEELTSRLREWKDREVLAAIDQGNSPEAIEDKFNCLVFFIASLDEDSRTIASLIAKIELMFEDTNDSGPNASSRKVTLSTIHKSKGLEWPVVFILDWNLLPSRYAKAAWAHQQERNLQYVAVTRTKLVLNFIKSDCWKEVTE